MKILKKIYKKILYRNKKFAKQGQNVIYEVINSHFSFEKITVGNDVFIASGAHFSGEIIIGDKIMFGPRVMIIAGDHLFGIVGSSVRFLKPQNNNNNKKVIIEDEVWCGGRVLILKGVRIGMGSVIGAGSIVTKDIPPYTVAVGNPCKPIKKIFSNDDLLIHLSKLGYDETTINKVINERDRKLKENDRINIPILKK